MVRNKHERAKGKEIKGLRCPIWKALHIATKRKRERRKESCSYIKKKDKKIIGGTNKFPPFAKDGATNNKL